MILMPEPIEIPKLPKLRHRERLDAATNATYAAQLTRAYQAGMSLRAIASDTGRSYGWVHRTLTEFGCELRGRGSAGRYRPTDSV